ncbi:ABC transporter substrate-binding protein [Actinomadura madurae]|uniref:ABC transporter substrate-binding protein n=1 Tax=Actinomadura madurae TaxID=1993 RepID=UPI0020D20B35|nr:ABC transporter substrate-binding protein [Actinomadura madurae]MCP9951447.1 ABC transporter substrate-binding protein [Actinomadura madurae]MCP9968223.1 ABC transporter substrate-binding protein [Actinomadura madurae]MCP9980681.1 ABC transporter substrate-binding protein [Actinomadura madurae]MCQ0007810.1 ABC transporter substrate-binding protein [Actinomadura madurae]
MELFAMRRWIPAALFALITPFALAACGDGGGEGSDTKISVAVFPIPQLLPLYVADSKGYFREEGVTIEPKVVTSGLIEGMQGGAFDIAFSGYPVPIQAIDKGIDLKLVAEADRGATGVCGIYVRDNSTIKTPRDLNGKTVATIRTDLFTWYAKKPLDEAGVNSGTVKSTVVPYENTLAALQRGSVDAALITEPKITLAKDELRARSIVDCYGQQSTRGLGDAGYFARSDWAGKNTAAIAAFRRTLTRALADIEADPAGAARAQLPKFAKIPAATAGRIKLMEYPKSTDPAQVQRVIDLMRELGMINKPLKAQDIIAR